MLHEPLTESELAGGSDNTGAVRAAGALCWVLSGLFVMAWALSTVEVSGVSDVPAYAKSLMYLSLSYHFDDYGAGVRISPPPPPSF